MAKKLKRAIEKLGASKYIGPTVVDGANLIDSSVSALEATNSSFA